MGPSAERRPRARCPHAPRRARPRARASSAPRRRGLRARGGHVLHGRSARGEAVARPRALISARSRGGPVLQRPRPPPLYPRLAGNAPHLCTFHNINAILRNPHHHRNLRNPRRGPRQVPPRRPHGRSRHLPPPHPGYRFCGVQARNRHHGSRFTRGCQQPSSTRCSRNSSCPGDHSFSRRVSRRGRGGASALAGPSLGEHNGGGGGEEGWRFDSGREGHVWRGRREGRGQHSRSHPARPDSARRG
mmetsp:Transcript_26396/g.60251  ORF Transcript_26396/g.60251 Transcript_26396/m.60251 type:complete len:246 (-) Transcript_26396:240-977(-)